MAAAKSSTWLITGASSGFGRSIANAAFSNGHKVIGTSRNVDAARESFPEFEIQGGIWKQLNPASKDAYEGFSKCAAEHDIDVLVNNAGYAMIGGLEDVDEQEVRDQMEVNFYGPLRTVRACLPVMRAKKSGEIVLISSAAGFVARPGRSAYSASKFAIEAAHESLSHEVSTLGIKVMIVEPGAFRTPFASRCKFPRHLEEIGGFSEGYKGTPLEDMMRMSMDTEGFMTKIRGDPDKAGNTIFKAVIEGHKYLRMVLGQDSIKISEDKIAQLTFDVNATREAGSQVGVD